MKNVILKWHIIANAKNKSVPLVCPMAAGDQGVEEEKAALSSPEDTSSQKSSELFFKLLNEVLGNYMEERVCEHEVSFNYAKYSEEQIKYKSTPTYELASARFETDKTNSKKNMAKYKGKTSS